MKHALIALLLFGCAREGGSATPPAKKDPAPVAIAQNLEVPWGIAFAPNERVLFTERPGRVRVIEKGKLRADALLTLTNVVARGEAGLMGIALHPDYVRNRYVYLCYATGSGSNLTDVVQRYTDDGTKLTDALTIVSNIPAARFHAGCELAFGPDRKLYITTGDATDGKIAQDLKSLGGKILRVNDDGSAPADNPFTDSPVWSYGHRNPQGIDWDPMSGLLFETEHGPSGFDGGFGGDEVNIVERGRNYGWPVIHHRDTRAGMISPFREYTPAHAPASAAFWKGDFFFGCLAGGHLHRLVLDRKDRRKVLRDETLFSELGRIREVVVGPDDALYFSTSNRDGRGDPARTDDRIFRLAW